MPDILEKSRFSRRSFTRNRKMNFQQAICFMLDMAHESIKVRLNRFLARMSAEVSMTQQAFSKLRNNFNHYPFEAMFRAAVSEEYSGSYPLETHEGYHIFAVDGSYLQLPDNPDTQREFGVRGAGGTASAGVSVLFDILHGWALDPILTHSDMNEREELKKHLTWIKDNITEVSKVLILLDRGYPSAEIIGLLEESDIKYLIRCKSGFSKSVKAAPMGASTIVMGDHEVQLHKLSLLDGEVEALLTNLSGHDSSKLGTLYHLRWGIETAYDQLKNAVCLENFSGKTPNSIRQDFWVSMLLMNSIAVYRRQADVMVQKAREGKILKHTYKPKTSDMVVTLRDRFIFSCLSDDKDKCIPEMDEIISLLAASVAPLRPGRSFKRKRKPNRAFNLQLKSHL